jgi:acetyltransferase
MINHTRIARLLDRFRNLPPVNRDAIIQILRHLSELVCELPEIRELDINPFVCNEDGAIVLDARIVVDRQGGGVDHYAHMAIHPYPSHLVWRWQLPDGMDVLIRPIRPEDAAIEKTFVNNLSEQAKYFRFMQALHELTPEMLVRFTQIDYDREMALIAVTREDDSDREIAVARYVANPDATSCEFAIVVADEWTHKGIGTRLMQNLMQVAKARGLRTMEGEVLAENRPMLDMAKNLGFTITQNEEDYSIAMLHKEL